MYRWCPLNMAIGNIQASTVKELVAESPQASVATTVTGVVPTLKQLSVAEMLTPPS